MPVSIITSLMLWASLLAPASRAEPVHAVSLDRAVAPASPESFLALPVNEPGSWPVSEADDLEEETDDGDPEGLASEAPAPFPHLADDGSVSAIRRDRAFVGRPTRSPILRC